MPRLNLGTSETCGTDGRGLEETVAVSTLAVSGEVFAVYLLVSS